MKIAAISTFFDEREFVSQFLMHYASQVDDIFLADNESTEDISDLAGKYSNVHLSTYKTGGTFDGWEKQRVLEGLRASCAGRYEYVLMLDIDELVVPKGGGTIREALEGLPGDPVYGTVVYNIYMYPGDLPYDPRKSALSQRKRGIQNSQYSKPIVVRPGYYGIYSLGCHYFTNAPMPTLVPFNLLHIRGFDDELFIERSLRFSGRLKAIKENYQGGGFYYWNCTREIFQAKLSYEKSAGQMIKVI